MADLLLQKPRTTEPLVVAPQTEDRLELGFATDEATMSREGDSLIFSFEDGARIELTDFYVAYNADNMPEFVVEGSVVPGDAFFAALGEDLMPAAGLTAAGGGGSIENIMQTELYEGIDATDGIDDPSNALFTPEAPEAPSVPDTQPVLQSDTNQNTPQTPAGNADAPAPAPEDSTAPAPEDSTAPAPTPAPEDSTAPAPAPAPEDSTAPAPAPTPTPEEVKPPTYEAQNEVIASDAGATVSGNLFANDKVTDFNPAVVSMTGPEGWTAETIDGNFVFTSPDGETSMTVGVDGFYTFTSNVENTGIDSLDFTYTAKDDNGTEKSASITIGNSDISELVVENFSNGQTEVTAIVRDAVTGEIISENTYLQDHSSYKGDANVGNHRIDGLLLGEGDDTITIENAQGESSAKPIFIYGDELQGYDVEEMGDDVINVGEMDHTLIRADGNLYDGDTGGADTVNVETMNSGSIFGDGWELYGGKGGDDEINVENMNGGVIRGDGEALRSTFEGGDDIINVGTMSGGTISGDGNASNATTGFIGGDDTITVDRIDTNSSADRITINGDSGDDFISVGEMDFTDGGFLTVNGGTGHDFFLYDSADDDTVALSNGSWYIAGESFRADNVEGMGTGAGNDLIKLYGTVDEETDVNGGDGMDVLLVNAGNIDKIESMLENGEITNTEMIVMDSGLNKSSTTSQEDLFNKLDGVSQEDGKVSFDESIWNRMESSNSDYDQFSSGDTTILVAKTIIESGNA